MRELWRRLAALLRAGRVDREVEEELRFHRAMKARETGDLRAAARAVGPTLLWRERARDAWGWRWLDDLAQDLRHTLRHLRAHPGFTAAAVSMLAAGIGLNVAVFTVANAVLFKGFRSIAGNGRILYVGTQKNGHGCCVSYPDFRDWRAAVKSFDDLAAVADQQVSLADPTGAAEHGDATHVTANTFALLGVRPILGRDFLPADERSGAAPVAILSHAFWTRRYGSDPGVLGRSIDIDGLPTTIVGVMPPGFSFPQNQDLWLPLVPTPAFHGRADRRLWFAFGHLAPGATFDSARAELALLGRRLARAHPQTNDGWVPTPRTFAQFFVGVDAGAMYGSLWAAVVLVLMIACASFTNLQLARAVARSREIAVRMALGAGRGRIARQLAVESMTLAATAGGLGWWMAKWAVRVYAATANPPTRTWSEHLLDYRMDHRVLLYGLGISVGTGLLVSIGPALRFSRLDVQAALRQAGRGATGDRRGRRLSAALIVAQVAVSVVLVAGAVLMLRSFVNLYAADLGVRADAILTGLIALPGETYPGAAQRASFFDRLSARLAALPGVMSVAVASGLPGSDVAGAAYDIADEAVADRRSRPVVAVIGIGPDYFDTVGARLLSGREFDRRDGQAGARAAIVNERFVREHWPEADPLGRHLRVYGGTAPGPWLTVVGVSSDIVQDGTRQRRDPIVYVPYPRAPTGSLWVLVRSAVPPAGLATAFRREVRALDANLPIWIGPYPLSERLAGTGAYWSTRNNAVLLATFAAIGLLLASLGLYALIAHAVSRRTQEIGIRMAVGASRRQILLLVSRRGMAAIGLGLLAGLLGSIGFNRLLRSQLVHVSPGDPLTYVLACGILAVFGMLGCLVPARRAARVDPVVALRQE